MKRFALILALSVVAACDRNLPISSPEESIRGSFVKGATDESFAYVAVFSGWVSVIGTSTNTEVTRVTVGDLPQNVAITPKGDFAYVTNSNSGDVSVIQTSTNTVVATITVGGYPTDVAITPKGDFAYVTDPGADGVVVLQTSTNTVVTPPIAVGVDPLGVAISPKGDFAYVAVNNSGTPPATVSVIETFGNTIVAAVPVGGLPLGVAITPKGDFAWVTSAFAQNVSVIRTADNTVTAIPVGGFLMDVAITPKGDFAYVTNSAAGPYTSGHVAVIETATNTIVARVLVGGDAGGVAIARVKGK